MSISTNTVMYFLHTHTYFDFTLNSLFWPKAYIKKKIELRVKSKYVFNIVPCDTHVLMKIIFCHVL